MATCGKECLKFMLYVYNLVIWSAGLLVMAVGIYARITAKFYVLLTDDGKIQTAANIMIAAGALMMIIGIIGCCGALKEKKWLLLMVSGLGTRLICARYAFLLALIFILEIVAGMLAYSHRDQVISQIEKSGKSAAEQDYGTKGKEDLTKAMDKAQQKFKCCGVDGPSDWKNSAFNKIPESCCISGEACKTNVPKQVFSEGCSPALQDFVKSRIKIVSGIGVGIAIIQILGIIFAICLFRSILVKNDVTKTVTRNEI